MAGLVSNSFAGVSSPASFHVMTDIEKAHQYATISKIILEGLRWEVEDYRGIFVDPPKDQQSIHIYASSRRIRIKTQ